MAQSTLLFSTRAITALFLVLALVGVQSTAYTTDDETQIQNSFKRLLLIVDQAFSDENLQCRSYTRDSVKACLLKAFTDEPYISACAYISRNSNCIVGGYYQCVNGYVPATVYLNTVQRGSRALGCTAGTSKRKREAEIKSGTNSKSQIIEASMKQIMSALN